MRPEKHLITLLAVLALFAITAPAASAGPWASNKVTIATYMSMVIDGELVWLNGTITIHAQSKYEDGHTHLKLQYRYDFVSKDGTIYAKGIVNSQNKYKNDAPHVSSYVYHFNIVKKGEGVVARYVNRYHYTFNAKGEPTAIKIVRLP